MKKLKRYCCGNGEGMFEDNKNGNWVEYSEHEAIVKALTEQLRKHDVVGRSEQLKAYTRWLRQNDHLNSAPYPPLVTQYLKSL